MPTTTLGSDFTIKVNGSAISVDWQMQVGSVEVDDSLYLPSMCVVRFYDPEYVILDSDSIAIGNSLEIGVQEQRQGDDSATSGTIFKGEITSLEPDFGVGFATFTIRAYDKAHRLMGSRNTKTYLNQTYSDIISSLAGTAGMTAEATSTSDQHEYVIQDNQTDYEFAQDLARRIGFVVRADGTKLLFKKPSQVKGSEIAVAYGQDLLSFRPRLSTAGQWASAKVRGWDVKTKAAIEGTGSAQTSEVVTALSTAGPAGHTRAFRSETWVIDRAGPIAQSEAQAFAEALTTRAAAGYAHAEGEIQGTPTVLAGVVLNVSGVGTRFNGKYFVTRATHRFDQRDGYRVHFEVENEDGRTTADLILRGAGTHEPAASAALRMGLTIGLVTDNNDPEKWGRVKVKLPVLPGEIETGWARMATPMAGNGRGLLLIPEVNDEVVVAFEDGDPNRPFVLGALWNGSDAPPETPANALAGGDVKLRVFKTRAGSKVTFDDTDNAAKVTIETKTGHKLELDDTSNGKLTFADSNGSNKVVIEVSSGKITIESATEIDLKSQTIKLTATNVSVSADAQLELKGGATLKASGPQVEVNGNGQLALKGGMVMIN